jgi:hypothetical protein
MPPCGTGEEGVWGVGVRGGWFNRGWVGGEEGKGVGGGLFDEAGEDDRVGGQRG